MAGCSRCARPSAPNWSRFAEEVKVELAKDPEAAGWSDEDLLMLAHPTSTRCSSPPPLFLEALEAPEEERERVTQLATRQLRLISIGRSHWPD